VRRAGGDVEPEPTEEVVRRAGGSLEAEPAGEVARRAVGAVRGMCILWKSRF